MPSKSSRMASRQAQLKKRKQKNRSNQVFDAGPTEPSSKLKELNETSSREEQIEQGIGHVDVVEDTETASNEITGRQQTIASAASTPKQSTRASAETSMRYPYLTQELRQIGVYAGLILGVLVVLTVLLRG